VTHVTTTAPALADTSFNGGQYRTPMEEADMFNTYTFESRLTAIIGALTLAAFIASVLA
jgi:hypothetical protein